MFLKAIQLTTLALVVAAHGASATTKYSTATKKTTGSSFEINGGQSQPSAAQGRVYHQWLCNADGLDCDFLVYYCWQSDDNGGCVEL